MFYCMFYFTCDLSLIRVMLLYIGHSGGVSIFKVFIEYPLINLDSSCISMFPANLTFGMTLFINDAVLLFFCKNRHFWCYKCVRIQNST